MLRTLRHVGRRLSAADRAIVRRISRRQPAAWDPVLNWLTAAADHSRLWFAIGGGMALGGGASRRAALRGVVAIAGTSAVTNLLAKRLLPRGRPVTSSLPPSSSSLPSGHAASAAAFSTAVCLEAPALGLVLAPVAAGVAYSRVHTGLHWPTDVLTGASLGIGVGLATRRWWPVRPPSPGPTRPHRRVAALKGEAGLEGGTGLVLLVNPESGGAVDDPAADALVRWPTATLVRLDTDTDLVRQLDRALDSARSPVTALGVAGGDGTVAAAASVAADRRLPLVVIPTGTLNHFARDVGIAGPDDAARAAAAGSAVHVDLARVEVEGTAGRRFVNTASLGGYPDMVRLRQRWENRWGKWPAAAAALIRVLAGARPISVRIDGRRNKIWLLFVGNNSYQPKGFAPTWRPRLDYGVLDIRYVRADLAFSRVRFVLAAVSGALFHSRCYVQEERTRCHVDVLSEPVALACDGEVFTAGHRCDFTARDETLLVYRPEHPVSG